ITRAAERAVPAGPGATPPELGSGGAMMQRFVRAAAWRRAGPRAQDLGLRTQQNEPSESSALSPRKRRILLITPLNQLANVADGEATLDRLRARYPGAAVALHASPGGFARWWALLQQEMWSLTCLAVWPRPDGSLGKGCADALGEALERGVPCVL